MTQLKVFFRGMILPKAVAICWLVVLSPSAKAQTLTAEYRIGQSNGKSIKFAAWGDDDSIVYYRDDGTFESKLLDSGKNLNWSMDGYFSVRGFAVSPSKGRLAFTCTSDDDFTSQRKICVINTGDGSVVFHAKVPELSLNGDLPGEGVLNEILPTNHASLVTVSILPIDGKLVVVASRFGKQGRGQLSIVSDDFASIEKQFEIDSRPIRVSLSPNGRRINIMGANDVLYIHDLDQDERVFHRSTRSDGFLYSCFYKQLFHDGVNSVIYVKDGGCFGFDEIVIETLGSDERTVFNTKDYRALVDVHFDSQRIAFGSSETGCVTILNFQGRILSAQHKVIRGNVTDVKFSPNGKRILVASDDNQLSVYSYDEPTIEAKPQ